MDRQKAEQILHEALQADENTRINAEKAIKSLIQSKFPEFLTLFGQIMLDGAVPLKIRHIASIIIKNTFHSRNARIQRSFEHNWFTCPKELRHGFVGVLESNLCIPDTQVLSNMSKILGSIVRMECANNVPNNHFERMYSLCANKKYAVGVLRTVSAACDQLYDETEYIFSTDQNIIFKIATHHFSDSTLETPVLYATLGCVYSSLEIFGDVLKDNTARNELLFNLSRFKDHKDEEVIEKSLEVLNRFVDTYHSLLKNDISLLCQFYITFLDRECESIRLQVFEFWELMCELEYEGLVKQFFPVLLPKLFSCLSKEDADDTDWTEHKAAASLLTLFAEKFKSEILKNEVSQAFIIEKFQSQEPEMRAVGAIAVGSVCEAGCPDFLYSTLGFLLADLGNPAVENEALYALARICEKDLLCTVNFLPTIVEKCGILISNSAESSLNAVWVYNAFLVSIKEHPSNDARNLLNYHYTTIITLLIGKLNSIRPEQYDLRNALSVTLSELICACPKNLTNILDSLIEWLVNKVSETLSVMGSANREQLLILEDILSNYIVLLQVALDARKLFDIKSVSSLFMSVLQSPMNKSHGEVYIAISQLITYFSPELRFFVPIILKDIESRDPFIAKSALNLLSDCATHLECGFLEFTPAAIPALINTISSPHTPLDFKPRVIEVFGHVALAIGRKFEPYLEMAIVLFTQINSLSRAGDEEYVDELRKSVIELFNYIVVSVGPTSEMKNRLDDILKLVETAVCEDADAAYQKESVDLIYDIERLFKGKVASRGWMKAFLQSVIATSTGKSADKAREVYQTCY